MARRSKNAAHLSCYCQFTTHASALTKRGKQSRTSVHAPFTDSRFNWIPRKIGNICARRLWNNKRTFHFYREWVGEFLIKRTFNKRQHFERSRSGSGRCLPPGLWASSFSALSAPIDPQVPLTGWWECELWPSLTVSHLSVGEWIVHLIKDHLWSHSLVAHGEKDSGEEAAPNATLRLKEREKPCRSNQLSLAGDFTCAVYMIWFRGLWWDCHAIPLYTLTGLHE